MIVRPATVTVMPVPTLSEAKVPVAPPALRLTVSPLKTPTSAAADVIRAAVVLALYTLFSAVMPETVSPAGVMLAVVVGWVSV